MNHLDIPSANELTKRPVKTKAKGSVSTLKRAEEVEITQEISEMEEGLWRIILSNRAKVRFSVDEVCSRLSNNKAYEEGAVLSKSLRKLSRLADRKAPKKNTKRVSAFDRCLDECVELACQVDIDRELVVAAAKEAVRRSTVTTSEGTERLLAHARKVNAAVRGSESLRHQFIQANQGLVVLIAGRYHWAKLPMNDLIQEGNLGLIKAVNRFDYTKGYQFSTYASWWIQSAIGRAIDNKENMIRIPSSAMRNRSRLRNALRTLTQQKGRNPTDKEIREETGMGRLKLERAKKNLVTHMYSLDQKVSESNSLRYQDILEDEHSPQPYEQTMVTSLAKEMVNHLGSLSQLEQTVLARRFGLGDCDILTLQEIAEQYGLSRERIRQIQNHAIFKLREKMALDAA